MLRIRLSRHGAKKDPHYRVVVAEKRSPRDGRFVEIVGHYNPAKKPVRLKLKLDRIDYWVERGAQPTQTVTSLIRRVRESGAENGAGEAPAAEAAPAAESQPAETQAESQPEAAQSPEPKDEASA